MDFKERLELIAKRNRKPRKHVEGEAWHPNVKTEAVSQYMILGNLSQVSALTGVPYTTLKKWKAAQWWQDLAKEIRATQNIEMDNKLSKIVEKSLDATLDRVENGDFIYDQKSGEIRRKPANLRDLHRVAVDTLDRRELLREAQMEKNDAAQLPFKEQLAEVAKSFAKMVESNLKNKPIDLVEVEDAVYAEREAGLQEGASMGTQEETGEGEGTSGEEFGSGYDGESREGS